MQLARQSFLALLVSFVVHLFVAGLLANIDYSMSRDSEALFITLVPSGPSGASSGAVEGAYPDPDFSSVPAPEPTAPAQEDSLAPPSTAENSTTNREFSSAPVFATDLQRPSRATVTTTPSRPDVSDLRTLFSSTSTSKTTSTAPPSTSRNDAGDTNSLDGDKQQAERHLQSHPSLLSPFQPLLLKHISQKKYHDKQYRFSLLDREHLVVLEVRLHRTGTLLNAAIAKSSGDPQLDEAARRATIAASPFSPPPPSDSRFGFTYLVPIQYLPR